MSGRWDTKVHVGDVRGRVSDGWSESADAWIAEMADQGDYARRCILDRPMLALALAQQPGAVLDLGCGEGRFCRLLAKRGVRAIGIDPTAALLERARALDPAGDYRLGRAERLEFPDESFDLVVSYLTLIDIPDLRRAVAEAARVLRPGGRLLIANLTSFNTASLGVPQTGGDGERRTCIDGYLQERAVWASWRGIRVRNWHRPLETYMSLLLGAGLTLRSFSEPAPRGGDRERARRYRRAPWFLIMEWEKPPAATTSGC